MRPILAFALLAFALGCSLARPGIAGTSEYKVELPADLRRIAGRGTPSPVTHALVTIATPDGLEADREVPVLVVSASSDAGYQSSRRLMEGYSKAALEAGWILVAADPAEAIPVEKDETPLRLALNHAALAVLKKVRPASGDAPIAFAGISGGAKYSGWLAAAFAKHGRKVIGVYQSGINQDTLSAAATHFELLKGDFKRVRVFLHAGMKDGIATPDDHRNVIASLDRAGFSRVKVVWTAGGHEVAPETLRRALEWFAEP
jgi:hypothetical protein